MAQLATFNPKMDNWILHQEQLEKFFLVNNIKQEESDERISALLSHIGADTDFKISLYTSEPKKKVIC